jgi:hypothetical protein
LVRNLIALPVATVIPRECKRNAEDESKAVPKSVPGVQALALLQTMLLLSVELGWPAMRGMGARHWRRVMGETEAMLAGWQDW